jgi:DNA polymerase-3 subunit beta
MNFTCNVKAFLNALAQVNKAVEPRNTIPILECVVIDARNNGIEIIGTDLDLQLSEQVQGGGNDLTECKIKVEKPGRITIAAKTLTRLVKKLPANGNLSFSVDAKNKEQVKMTCGKLSYSLNIMDVNDFPVWAEKPFVTTLHLPPDVLKHAISHVAYAQSTEETRFYLNGIYFHFDAKPKATILKMITTDGHQLAYYQTALKEPVNGNLLAGAIVHSNMIKRLMEHLDSTKGLVEISLGSEKARFSADKQWTLDAKLVNGTFPDYTRVMPQANEDLWMQADVEELKQALDNAFAVSSLPNRAIKMEMAAKLPLRVSCIDPDMGTGLAEMPVEFHTPKEPLTIGFNYKYMKNACNNVDGKTIRMEFSDSTKPARITDTSDPDLIMVLMPMRV